MPAFFGDWSSPRQQVIDPRKQVRFVWLYYTVEGDDMATGGDATRDDDHRRVRTVTVAADQGGYTMPPYTMLLGQVYSWRIIAFIADKDYDPLVATSDTNYPGVKEGAGNTNLVDASGWELSSGIDSVVTSGSVGTGTVPQASSQPADQGEYEVRIAVRNGFQWSPWSSIIPLKIYDTRRYVLKSGVWQAVPAWKKTSGTFQVVVP